MRPLCIELFAGTFGWSAGWLELGGRAVGFDLEHLPHHGRVPSDAELVLQDVHTLHGRQFRNASLILAGPPCPEFSYMAMPWSRAKQIAKALRREHDERGRRVEFPEGYTGSRTVEELTALFDACFRIQREACEAAGRYIPMAVENVKGAQPWVGKAKANYGSFYLWGDVGMVGNRVVCRTEFGQGTAPIRDLKGWGGTWFHNAETGRGNPNRDRTAIPPEEGRGARKNGEAGGSWFPQGNGAAVCGNHGRDGLKVPGLNFHEHEKTEKPGRSFQSAAVKMSEAGEGVEYGGNFGWDGSAMRTGNSKSSARKAASAQIAKIPRGLSNYAARCFWLAGVERTA